jgi:hypothetical protein
MASKGKTTASAKVCACYLNELSHSLVLSVLSIICFRKVAFQSKCEIKCGNLLTDFCRINYEMRFEVTLSHIEITILIFSFFGGEN